MTSKILKSILSVAMTVLFASLLIITCFLYQYFGNIQRIQLKDELSLAAAGTEEMGEAYLEKLDESGYRLTWVSTDGSVLFDNQVEAKELGNHKDRQEIQEAFTKGSGSSSRYSATLTEQNIYEAVRLTDGSVLRISESRVTVFVLILGMMQPIAVLIFAALGLSFWLANRMAKKVVEPLNKLNLDQPLENDAYEELSPLLRRLHWQQQEIKKQMHTLRRKQEEFNQITGNLKEILVLLDGADKVVSMNPAAEKWFDVTQAEGTDFLHIDRRTKMQSAMEDARNKGMASFREQRNGREYQFELSSIESEGIVVGIVILGFDITEQVNAEQNRREFTANVSHELKTPLQSILGSAELLEHGIVKSEDVPRFVGHIRKEASRLLTLIQDIIRLSQLDEGSEMPREEVSLRELAEEVCDTLTEVAGREGILLEVTGESGIMTGVRRLLYEIIYNLCDNAIKYNRPKGQVKISVTEAEDTATLVVEDTGIGIAPADQEKIFERFYRVDKSHSKQSGGTGLGLSIVKHGVQYHHGKIQIESKKDEGTRISINFPKGVSVTKR